MPYKSRDDLRAFERKRNRTPGRMAWRRRYLRDWRARKRVEAAIPAGTSPALDHLRQALRETRDPATRKRFADAIAHMERVVSGQRVKPRDLARVNLSRPRMIGERFNFATPGQNDPDRVKATADYVPSWMDRKLGPESA